MNAGTYGQTDRPFATLGVAKFRFKTKSWKTATPTTDIYGLWVLFCHTTKGQNFRSRNSDSTQTTRYVLRNFATRLSLQNFATTRCGRGAYD